MRVHHYTGEGIDTIEADDDRRLSEVLEVEETLRIFAVSNDGVEIEVDAHLRELTEKEVLRVTSHPQRSIEVTVSYGGRSVSLDVSPGTRMGAVRAQAVAQLNIDPIDAADLGLRTIGGESDLPADEPIAQVARQRDHLELQLVAMVHPQG